MPDDLVLYTNPLSRGRVTRWMLEEIGQPYRTEIIDYGPPMKSPDYLAINPMGKVPALKHGDMVITEGAAICTYLADTFPEAGLMPPPGSPERGAYYRWMFFASGPMEHAVINNSFGFSLPDQGNLRAGYGSYDLILDTLDAHLSDRTYLIGETFTGVDVYLGAFLGFGMMTDVIEKRPTFEAYFGRVASRPAAIRAREIDDELAAAAQAGG